MNNNPIGIIDSGVGGLTIWKEIRSLLPQESTLYIADTKNCPYGIKSPDEIYLLAKRLVAYLISQEVKLIVLACNTITVNCLERFRIEFPQVPIIGTVPVVKTAVEKSIHKKIGVLSTQTTAASAYQAHLLQTFAHECEVVNLGTDKFVPFVERGEIEGEEVTSVVSEVVKPFTTAGVDVIALGCTHFPFLKPVIQQVVGPEVQLLDSGSAIARQVARVLEQTGERSHSEESHTLYTTGDENNFTTVIAKLLPTQGNFISNIKHLRI